MSHYQQRNGRPSPRIAGDVLQSVFTRYMAGETAKEIAISLGESRSYISLLLSRNDIKREREPLITAEHKSAMIARYAAGESPDILSIEFNVPRVDLTRWARKLGVRRSHRLTAQDRISAISAYAGGTRSGLIAADLGVTGSSIRGLARRAGLPGRTSRRVPVNDAAFSELTPAARYWIGFLMADGCVKRPGLVIALALSAIDKAHVMKFRNFCGSEHAIVNTAAQRRGKGIVKNSEPVVSVSVWSPQIVNDIGRFGIVPRKTGTEHAPDALTFDRDFWRGMIDGDGTIGLYRRGNASMAKLCLCGPELLMTQFITFAETIAPENKSKPWRRGNLWLAAINGRAAAKVIRYLYWRPAEALERKAAKAKTVLAYYDRQ